MRAAFTLSEAMVIIDVFFRFMRAVFIPDETTEVVSKVLIDSGYQYLNRWKDCYSIADKV